MPTWLHVLLFSVGSLAGAFFACGWAIDNPHAMEAYGISSDLFCFGMLFLGALIPMGVMRYLVPAICPKCGKRTHMKWSKPVAFHCRECGHVHETIVS